ACGWKLFAKAGQPGWAALVPIYNAIVFLKIIGRPAWWLVLFLVPVVSMVVAIIANIDLAKSFGKSTGFAVGLILLGPVFLAILPLRGAGYKGPAASEGAAAPAMACADAALGFSEGPHAGPSFLLSRR